MLSSRILIFVTTFLAGVTCAVIPSSHAIHERRNDQNTKWVKRGKIQSHAILPIRIGIAQSNLDRAHDFLMDVSDPSSSNYGKHWTDEEITEKFKPSEESIEHVYKWLEGSGISRNRITHSDNKGWLAFDATTKESEDLLLTEFHEFGHVSSKEVSVACDVYHIPKEIQPHIDYITPGIRLISMTRKILKKRGFGVRPGNNSAVDLPKPPPVYVPPPTGLTGLQPLAAAQASPLITCNQAITPACIQALYGVPPGRTSSSSNKMGIFEYYDAYDQPDLDAFWANYYPSIKKGTGPKLASIDGGQAPVAQVNAGGESILDFDIAYPLLWPQGTVLYQVGLSSSFNSFLDALDGVSISPAFT